MLGHSYPVVIGGAIYAVDGTSASAPVFAAVLSLVNAQRLRAKLPPVGFANPTLYALQDQHPSAFHDITTGSNECPADPTNCCDKVGFYATPGWDAVTGLGSVDVGKLLDVWPAKATDKKKSQGHRHRGKNTWFVGTSAFAVQMAVIAILAGSLMFLVTKHYRTVEMINPGENPSVNRPSGEYVAMTDTEQD